LRINGAIWSGVTSGGAAGAGGAALDATSAISADS